MSKLPKISAHNSDSIKNPMGYNYNGNDIYNYDEKDTDNNPIQNSEIPNGNNNFPQLSNRQQSINNNKAATIQNLKGYFPLVIEAKLNELETKLISLEQTNYLLNDRLKTNERSFELKLKEMQQINIEERDSRMKLEKDFNYISDKSSMSTNELKNRIQLIQEIVEKEEKWKYEQRQNDIEVYKNIISKLSEKVSETVKMEIEARFKADLDNKNLIQVYSQKTLNEIDTVRREMDELGDSTKTELKEYSKECSVRAHNLSKYIDQVVADSTSLPKQGLEKMRIFISKLTDQVKTNIESQNIQNQTQDDKINKLEGFSKKIKEEVYNFVNIIEDRLMRKMKDLKNYADVNIRKNFDGLNGRISELGKNTENNFKIISSQLSDTRNKIFNKVEDLESLNKNQFKVVCEDIESITERVYIYENLLEQFEGENNQIKTRIETDLASMQSTFHINTVNERILHKIQLNELKSDHDTLQNHTEEFQVKITNDMEDMMEKLESNFSTVYEKSKMSLEQMNKMYQSNIQIFNEFESTFERIQENSDASEINNLMNGMLGSLEENEIHNKITKIENAEKIINQNLNNIELELNSIKHKISNDKINIDSSSIVDDQGKKSESIGKEHTSEEINQSVVNKEANQTEDNVTSIMDRILNKIERDEFTQNINLRLSKNEVKNREVIERLMEFNEQLNNIDKEFSQTNDVTKKALLEFNIIIENKVNSILEKLKKENVDMWNKAIELTNKFNQPDEIRKIIQQVPPVVTSRDESVKTIYELQHGEEKKPKPILRKFRKESEDKPQKKVNFKSIISESESSKNLNNSINKSK